MKREEEHHAARNLMLFVLENDDLIKYRRGSLVGRVTSKEQGKFSRLLSLYRFESGGHW